MGFNYHSTISYEQQITSANHVVLLDKVAEGNGWSRGSSMGGGLVGTWNLTWSPDVHTTFWTCSFRYFLFGLCDARNTSWEVLSPAGTSFFLMTKWYDGLLAAVEGGLWWALPKPTARDLYGESFYVRAPTVSCRLMLFSSFFFGMHFSGRTDPRDGKQGGGRTKRWKPSRWKHEWAYATSRPQLALLGICFCT